MPERYSASEALEHVEHAHELLERSENAMLRWVPLLAAVLAIFAGLSSLYAGRLTEETLTLKNEAVLNEVKASDLWNEYQAESLKAHLYDAAAAGITNKTALARLRSSVSKYRDEQKPLLAEAKAHEAERDQALSESDKAQRRKAVFDIALALFEVSIVLTSIAAMLKRRHMFVLAAAGGVAGMAFALYGLWGHVP
ncbi:MAG: hypothetical protein DLM53_05740 [Candidatus Eremiobacter antarcticus]|nr:DUF4337 family protein [Candidatus Eremiobacteraeota bacterium]MBC5808559.1 DUF4337 family protein [Candidatus Eremiobacteraeota bacterium]PZR62897.1 MAG: hypothetical protein DLM53_05740 [Candidatus Eremiobacter sp. RRmetagenome_bin22]